SSADASAAGSDEMLAGKVRGAPQSISGILSRVRVAESLNDALAIRGALGDGESVVTADGIWLGRSWLRVSRDKDARSGLLSREHEMRRVKTNLREYRARFESARKLLTDGRTRLTQLEERREAMQGDAAAVLSEHSEVRSALDSLRYQLEQMSAREAALTQEAHEVDNEKISAEEQLRESQRLFVQADSSLEELAAVRANLEAGRAELREELERVRAQAREDRDAVQKIRIQFESRRSSRESAAQNLERMQSQLKQFQTREQEIRAQLEQREAPLAEQKARLEEQLAQRVRVEQELAAARRLVEDVENELRELDQGRMQVEQAV
ncbi:MAG: chromosome segregation protein SMC, partial [Gammaproteobacteria bacterium]|nr:chromosome segregation protein SMC [Gammaproteobacteria bacterium]NIT15628.1 chromosome segregation protein SMC [Gammaproteobacteria bacterium]NIT91577.1 chromosome segregation protein SMC [Gammaproteobacteria bacterium]